MVKIRKLTYLLPADRTRRLKRPVGSSLIITLFRNILAIIDVIKRSVERGTNAISKREQEPPHLSIDHQQMIQCDYETSRILCSKTKKKFAFIQEIFFLRPMIIHSLIERKESCAGKGEEEKLGEGEN